MKTLPIQKQTIDAKTGEVLNTETIQASILPPPADKCQVCGHGHEPEQPHNPDSLYYQYAFYGEHGRWPTWADALAHCDEKTRAHWTYALKEIGIDVAGGAE